MSDNRSLVKRIPRRVFIVLFDCFQYINFLSFAKSKKLIKSIPNLFVIFQPKLKIVDTDTHSFHYAEQLF